MTHSSLIRLKPQEAISHESGARCVRLDAERWHFQHGPIDIVLAVEGEPEQVGIALDKAWTHFGHILPDLAAQLPLLRRPVEGSCHLQGAVAPRMWQACLPYAACEFITPMAAVAGAISDEVIGLIAGTAGITRAYANNGGDIALHLGPGTSYRIGLFADIARYQGQVDDLDGRFLIDSAMPVRGVATSGWQGRSLSMGIADSVTVLAATAAQADAAATMVANHVDTKHDAIQRAPADTVKDDSDLGSRLVTVEVGQLPHVVVAQALENGAQYAARLVQAGHIYAAVLTLQGQSRVVPLGLNPLATLPAPQAFSSTNTPTC